MSKSQKAKLKKIYQQEYEKALKSAKVSQFNDEVNRIKRKAKADAKRKVDKFSKKLVRGSVGTGKKLAKGAKAYRKRHRKTARRISSNIERMNRELGF